MRAHYTPTPSGRRYDATGVDLTARATTALNAAGGGGPVDWETDLPIGTNRFVVAAKMGDLESPVVDEFARAMAEVTSSDAYQFSCLWAQVGVSLPGEAGLLTASMVPGVGESMDAHSLAHGETAFERWTAGASLTLSGITLGATPNFGRFARFVGDIVNSGTRRGVKKISEVAVETGAHLRRVGGELAADTRVFGRAYWQAAHAMGVIPQDPLMAGARAVRERRALAAPDFLPGSPDFTGPADLIGPRLPDAAENAGDDFVVSFMGKNALGRYNKADATLGAPGGTVWVAPLEDVAGISNRAGVVTGTGHAPGPTSSYKLGDSIYGIAVPRKSLKLELPTPMHKGANKHFRVGGFTGVEHKGVWKSSGVRELITDGGNPVPERSVFFEFNPNGSRTIIRRF